MQLSDDEIDKLAQKVTDKMLTKMINQVYLDVGRSFMSKLFWFIGIVLVGSWAWLHQNGFLK